MKIPKWFTTSYRLNFPDHVADKPIIQNKVFTTQIRNIDQTKELMQLKGVHTQTEFGTDNNQPKTFRTFKWPCDACPMSDQELYNFLRGFAQQYGLTKLSIITDEIPENSQGTDPNISTRVKQAYQGVLDYFRQTEPTLKARDTNLFGSYGVDNLDKLFNVYALYESENELLQYVTTHVHDTRNINNGQWDRVNFYQAKHFEVRNANLEYYMYEGKQPFYIPYEILFAKERLSVGTQTYENQNREVDFIIYTTPNLQTLVRNDQGQQVGVEEGRRQDVIPFSNGVVKAYVTHAWIAEVYTMSFWGTLLGRGVIQWGELIIGNDPTKIRFSPDFNVGYNSWTPTGGSEQLYQSGVNGAPLRSDEGVNPYLSTIVDASYVGWSDARDYIGWTDNLYYANYTSSRKSFSASPGTTGLYNVNGFGPLNYGQISFKKALDQKKGIALYGSGVNGKSMFYYNGFLKPDEYEDNVTVSYGGETKNLGRVYGRQTAHIKF